MPVWEPSYIKNDHNDQFYMMHVVFVRDMMLFSEYLDVSKFVVVLNSVPVRIAHKIIDYRQALFVIE